MPIAQLVARHKRMVTNIPVFKIWSLSLQPKADDDDDDDDDDASLHHLSACSIVHIFEPLMPVWHVALHEASAGFDLFIRYFQSSVDSSGEVTAHTISCA